jgi:predicted Zn finger-like uncharacterized protein
VLRYAREKHPGRTLTGCSSLVYPRPWRSTTTSNARKETPMVKHFDPSCPKCKQKFHVHHEDLRYAGIKLLCPYCQNEFFVDECETLVEHDGTVTHPKQRVQAH